MKAYLSHESALEFWNFPLAQQFFARHITLAGGGGPQYTVLHKHDIFVKDTVPTHLCSLKLTKDSFVVINKVHVVSPKLMFVQLVNKLDLHEAIILGNLLCACPEGPRSEPLITKSALENFVLAAKGHNGLPRARMALQYVEDRSCSIMEVFVGLFLSLPNHLGGLGLKGGCFNYIIQLDRQGAAALGQDSCYVDYCFPAKKIAFEYLGETHKNTLDFDSARNMTLTRLGFTVITITKSQLYNPLKLSQLLDQAADLCGAKIRIRTKKYVTAQLRIRELLPKLSDRSGSLDLSHHISSGVTGTKKLPVTNGDNLGESTKRNM